MSGQRGWLDALAPRTLFHNRRHVGTIARTTSGWRRIENGDVLSDDGFGWLTRVRKVYTRWPAEERFDGQADLSLDGRGLPAWAEHSPPAAYARRATLPTLAIVGFAGLLAAVMLIDDWRPAATPPFVLALALAISALAGLVLWIVRRQGLRIETAERRFDAIFERAGISVWDEDWSAVGAAISKLRRAGIEDMRAHFTKHPEQAHALRQQVIIRNVNAFTVQMMGGKDKTAFLGPLDRVLPNTDQTFLQWLVALGRGDRFFRSETHLIRPDGSTLDCLFTAALPTDLKAFETIIVSCLDVSDYKAAQARLMTAETVVARATRVSTVGALTATIAHEVNQPLAAIISNAEACMRWLDRDTPDVVEALESARGVVIETARAREVVERTRSFLGNSPRRTTVIDLVETLRGGIAMIDRDLRTLGASVHFDADDDMPEVVADPVQLQQVLTNLLLNGAHAMDEVAGPRDLTVTLRRDGTYACVDVADRGRGISPDAAEAVFDPFYSTRHDGMGMGLAICRTCIEAHGGRVHFRSVVGQGSVFSFDIPVAGA